MRQHNFYLTKHHNTAYILHSPLTLNFWYVSFMFTYFYVAVELCIYVFLFCYHSRSGTVRNMLTV